MWKTTGFQVSQCLTIGYLFVHISAYSWHASKVWWPVCAISSFPLFAAKRRHAKRRKDEKNTMRKDTIWNYNFLVFSHGVFSSFRMASFRCYFVFPHSVFSSFRTRKDEILARKDENTPCENTPFETIIFSSFRMASSRLALFCLSA